MRSICITIHILLFSVVFTGSISAHSAKDGALKIIIIRHGEKPSPGDNLSCKGLNRALRLPKVLYSKFGVPDYVYVPSLSMDVETKHARMFETIVPFAVKYNLDINSSHPQKDYDQVAADIKGKKGIVLMIWEHKAISPLVAALGVKDTTLAWPDDDYDSIWIVNITNGIATMSQDKEGIDPRDTCPF